MAIVFYVDTHGGFTAGDTVTGLTSYAYPSSEHATKAKREPRRTAAEMMERENRWRASRDSTQGEIDDGRHWQWFERLNVFTWEG